MQKHFGILVDHPNQRDQVNAHCFGDCGKISMGIGIDTGLGPMLLCYQQTCPYVGAETEDPIGKTANGEIDVYLRALQKEPS